MSDKSNILSNISTFLKVSCAVIDTIDQSLNNSDPQRVKTNNDRICKFYSSGKCKFGDKCRFKHC